MDPDVSVKDGSAFGRHRDDEYCRNPIDVGRGADIRWRGMGEEEQRSANLWWQEWLEYNRWWVLMGMVGLGLLALGVRYWGDAPGGASFKKQESRVEILPMQEGAQSLVKLVVDVGGSVKQPGIYELSVGARIGEALAAAGGLAEDADSEWVEQVMNRAEKVRDGQKIYVLSREELKNKETLDNRQLTLDNKQGVVAGVGTSSTVSINSASEAELESLWGIGEVTAKAIIEGRPYGAVEELIERKILKRNVYDKIKERLTL